MKEQIKLVAKSISMLEGLKKKKLYHEKIKTKITLNWILKKLLTLYLLPNVHRRLSNLPGHPRYFGLWYPRRKRSGILRSWFAASNERKKLSYINYRWDLGEITEETILVTTDMLQMYPSISHIEGLEVLRKQYGTQRRYQEKKWQNMY